MADSVISHSEFSALPRLLDQVRGKIRLKHYSLRTEQIYLDWIKRFIRHHGKRHPGDMGAPEVKAFLTHLAVGGREKVSRGGTALAKMRLPLIDL